jgi:ABC-2 type transport system ATP-binding protein
MHALEVKDLQKTYKTGVKALNGVSFTVEEGEMFALLGANGAGKTTLIGILTGLVNKTGGTGSVFGVDIDKDPAKARGLIGVVPQEFNFSIFEKVQDIVVDAAGYYGIPRSVAVPRAEAVLKELGLWEKRNVASRTLSGGMKRRLLIARALIHEPKLLLLDEPSAGVDVELRRGMWEFIQKLNANGTTIILTTHYLEEAEKLCKRVVIMKEGNVVKEGNIMELMKESGESNLENFYLSVTKNV